MSHAERIQWTAVSHFLPAIWPTPGEVPRYCLYCDQVIREDPAVRLSCVRGRGTETSAEVLVARSALADGVERRSTAVVLG